MKAIGFVSFAVPLGDGGEKTFSTADLLVHLARAHDGRGPSSDDILLLMDVRTRLEASAGSADVLLENAEHAALKRKLDVVRWFLEGREVANFIREIKEPREVERVAESASKAGAPSATKE